MHVMLVVVACGLCDTLGWVVLLLFVSLCFFVLVFVFFFFNDTATTEIYTLSLHDALPISVECVYSP